MKTFLSGALVVMLLAYPAHAKDIERKISIEEGNKLVKLALASTNMREELFMDPPGPTVEPFLIYPILGATEGILSNFGVNAWTGDVWDTFACKRVSNPKLRAEQARIKQRFHGKELKEYSRLQALKPERGYDLEPCR